MKQEAFSHMGQQNKIMNQEAFSHMEQKNKVDKVTE
jgi:hypothetical protein